MVKVARFKCSKSSKTWYLQRLGKDQFDYNWYAVLLVDVNWEKYYLMFTKTLGKWFELQTLNFSKMTNHLYGVKLDFSVFETCEYVL